MKEVIIDRKGATIEAEKLSERRRRRPRVSKGRRRLFFVVLKTASLVGGEVLLPSNSVPLLLGPLPSPELPMY